MLYQWFYFTILTIWCLVFISKFPKKQKFSHKSIQGKLEHDFIFPEALPEALIWHCRGYRYTICSMNSLASPSKHDPSGSFNDHRRQLILASNALETISKCQTWIPSAFCTNIYDNILLRFCQASLLMIRVCNKLYEYL